MAFPILHEEKEVAGRRIQTISRAVRVGDVWRRRTGAVSFFHLLLYFLYHPTDCRARAQVSGECFQRAQTTDYFTFLPNAGVELEFRLSKKSPTHNPNPALLRLCTLSRLIASILSHVGGLHRAA